MAKSAQINPADPNPGETSTTKYFSQKCQAGRGKAPSVCVHMDAREMPAAAWMPAAAQGTGGTSASTFLKPEISQKKKEGSDKATWTMATGWQQKLVDPVLA